MNFAAVHSNKTEPAPQSFGLMGIHRSGLVLCAAHHMSHNKKEGTSASPVTVSPHVCVSSCGIGDSPWIHTALGLL
jgi:hypothetical protein